MPGRKSWNGTAAEHLARNLDFGAQFQQIIVQFGELADVDGAEVFGSCKFLDLFHDCVRFWFVIFLLRYLIAFKKSVDYFSNANIASQIVSVK